MGQDFFYRIPPSKSLCQGPQHGTKQFKDDRVTVALCVNADGSDHVKLWRLERVPIEGALGISARTPTSSMPITTRVGWWATYFLSCIISIITSRTRKITLFCCWWTMSQSTFLKFSLSASRCTICIYTPLAIFNLWLQGSSVHSRFTIEVIKWSTIMNSLRKIRSLIWSWEWLSVSWPWRVSQSQLLSHLQLLEANRHHAWIRGRELPSSRSPNWRPHCSTQLSPAQEGWVFICSFLPWPRSNTGNWRSNNWRRHPCPGR